MLFAVFLFKMGIYYLLILYPYFFAKQIVKYIFLYFSIFAGETTHEISHEIHNLLFSYCSFNMCTYNYKIIIRMLIFFYQIYNVLKFSRISK